MTKPRLLDDRVLTLLAGKFGTPLYVYEAGIIRKRIGELRGFDVIRYAQKANSNLALLALMRREGVVIDAVSAGEVERALAAGYAPHEIVFTADLFDRAALSLLEKHPIPINVGSPDMLEQYALVCERAPGVAAREVTLRINPGFGHGHGHKVSTGGENSKHGIWHEDLARVVANTQRLGLSVTGLHVHIGSGSDLENLSRVTAVLQRLCALVGKTVTTLSTGGGLPVPYRAGERRFDLARFVAAWQETRANIESELGRRLRLEVEPGRYLVAEAGLLLSEVRGTKLSGSVEYILVDAGFNNLIRPAMYGAYHQISVVGRDDRPRSPRVVAGPLCESADVFTLDPQGRIEPQALPEVVPGDLVCIHDTGAYGASMASNYNSQPLAAEVLVDGATTQLIRRRQTIEHMLANEIAWRTFGSKSASN